MLLSVYKILAYIGMLLMAGFFVCQVILTTDHSGLDIDLGIAFNVFWIVLQILMFVFFMLPLYYIKSYSKKIFISILIIGVIAMIVPATSTWENIKDWLYPPKMLWPFSRLFEISEFRKKINNIEHIILGLIFACQFLIFMLTFKVKKQAILINLD